MEQLDVLCIGELNVDIFCSALEEMPDPGAFVLMDRICMFPGGCPTNTAIVTSTFKLRTGLNSLVGGDSSGEFVLSELRKFGVITDSVVPVSYGETGKTIILISKVKDRVLLHYTGINGDFNLDNVNMDMVANTRSVLISSYISGLPKLRNDAAETIFRRAKEGGALTFLDMLVDPDEPDPMGCLEGVLEHTDYIILNNIEGRLVTGKDDYQDQAAELLKAGARNVILKLGKDGSYFLNQDKAFHTAPYIVEAEDPTGSGDSFNGGFIYGCLQGWDEERTMRFANIVGASAVTEIGCTCGVFDLEEILEIMNRGDKS